MAALFFAKGRLFYQRWWVLDYWLTNANIDEQTGRPARPSPIVLGQVWPVVPTAQALPNGPIFVPGRPKWPDQNGVPGPPK